ncbi:dehydrogenase/reductase SDR family member 12-like isoform X2 [Artemia franciscana]|uniref:Dehydrogenase/reductase SDR family member 12 n=1 Tax=Artemia franciscana TaxID=6661 RepID=A0AA88HZ17_ARTSF|nr:hypothetical protein QYM36_005326 [Artemia franciscana]
MSFYRNAVWMAKGITEYTKSGFESASKSFNPSDLEVSCKGRSYMITGANSGIGKSVACQVAKRGGTVHMVVRNPKSGEAAREELVKETGNEDIHVHILDLSKPRDVYKFGKSFSESGSLNVLVNNAGCMVNTREINEDGLEANFATNTLGTHILTRTLIPALERTEKPRVVIVSSGGMLVQTLNLDDFNFEKLKPFDGTMAYAQNKRQQIVMAEEYAKQYPKVHFATMHPGWADTPAVKSSMPDFYEKVKSKLRTPEQGADTAIWLAICDKALEHPSGEFFQDRKPVAKHLPLAWTKSSKEEQETLMKRLDELMEKFKP